MPCFKQGTPRAPDFSDRYEHPEALMPTIHRSLTQGEVWLKVWQGSKTFTSWDPCFSFCQRWSHGLSSNEELAERLSRVHSWVGDVSILTRFTAGRRLGAGGDGFVCEGWQGILFALHFQTSASAPRLKVWPSRHVYSWVWWTPPQTWWSVLEDEAAAGIYTWIQVHTSSGLKTNQRKSPGRCRVRHIQHVCNHLDGDESYRQQDEYLPLMIKSILPYLFRSTLSFARYSSFDWVVAPIPAPWLKQL